MSGTNDNTGCGCLALLLALVVALIAYPLYDGYINRTLPDTDTALIVGTANVQQVADGWYFSVELSNQSEWILRGAKANVSMTFFDGRTFVASGDLLHLGKRGVDIAAKDGAQFGAFKLSKEAAEHFARKDVKSWEWELTSVTGRRRPIRLVKVPIDWVAGLFSRE